MTGAPLTLDADGLDALTEQPPPDLLRALLAEAWERKSDVMVPALVCAECCRGAGRTRAVESSLARHRETRGARPAVRVGGSCARGPPVPGRASLLSRVVRVCYRVLTAVAASWMRAATAVGCDT